MLIDHYDLEVFTPPCEPGAERFSAIARFGADISEVLPYLNATLKDALYNPGAQALIWQRGGRKVVFSANQIAVSNLEDRKEAEGVIQSEVDRVNRTWGRRGDVTPSTQVRQRATPLEVYKLMPQTNCKVCGEPTCYVFATKLAAGQQTLSNCPELRDSNYCETLAALQRLIGDINA